jgi:pimeloyl-ACP methyl ester carboxylesterase
MPEISAARYRAGEGEPLVLVHGFTATWQCWRPVIADLVPRFEVIAPTLTGHDGGPPVPPEGGSSSIAEAADHFEGILDDLGVDDAHFAGNSMGGALALELAKRGRARSVVAISPGGGWSPDDTAETRRIVRFFARMQRMSKASLPYLDRVMSRPGTRRAALRDVMTRGDQVPRDEAAQLVRSSVRCNVVDEVFETLRAGRGHLTDLDQVKVPTLVTWGTRDKVLPLARNARRFRIEIPGVEYREHPGIGHTPMWDDPHLIASTIGDWAEAHSKAAAPAAAV